MNWLAFDIGGANLKMADGRGYAVNKSFAMWKESKRLASELRRMIAEAPASDRIVVTMTAELADCFESKAEGVRFILQAVHQAAAGRHTRVYLADGRLVAPSVALRDPLQAAATNWRALAAYVTRFAPSGPALLMDVGSTTTDLIPLKSGTVIARGNSDTERLLNGELVYTGVERTPICSIVSWAPYRNQQCPLMREVFATTLDVYLLTGHLLENGAVSNTADGRPATKAAARTRISRMIGAPEEQFNHRDAVSIAQHVMQQQLAHIAAGARQVAEHLGQPPNTLIVAGQGEFLAAPLLDLLNWKVDAVVLSQKLGQQASRAAPAHALAVITRKAIPG
jgi:probable H4MPT-linked C1 transfer pathway protein